MSDEKRLSDVATVIMGTSPKGGTYNNDGNGIPLLNGPTEFGPSHPYCTLFTTASIKECKKGDLIFCVRGSTTGRMNWADQVYSLGRGVCSIRGETALDTKFLKFCIQCKLDALLILAGGATMPNLTTDTIKSFPIPYPKARRKIASILSAYDDLIENNTRRIAILEEMAQAIYREWFVNFRFPGHENVKLVQSTLGMIPEGWEPTELGSCSQIVPGYAFKSKDWQESGVPVVKIKNITENNCVDMESADCVSESLISDKMHKFMLKTGDLLIAMTGATAGKAGVLRMRVPSALNQRVAKICPNDGFRSLLWCFIIGNRKLFFNLADGAAQPNMSGGQIESVPLLVPSGHILSLFESSVCDIAKLVDSLYFKNRNLRTTRDLLLPKLISGLLDVEDLDIDTGLTAEELEEATA